MLHFNSSTKIVTFWHGGLSSSGLTLDIVPKAYPASPVHVSDAMGTRGMSLYGDFLVWNDRRFGSWLACNFDGTAELFWLDLYAGRGYDKDHCAQVQLHMEYA